MLKRWTEFCIAIVCIDLYTFELNPYTSLGFVARTVGMSEGEGCILSQKFKSHPRKHRTRYPCMEDFSNLRFADDINLMGGNEK